MKNIIANIVRGGGKPLSYLLAAIFAFSLAETAQAATDIYWKTDKVGGSEGSPYFLKDAGNWQSNGPAGDNKAIHFNITGARTYISSSGVESRTSNDFTPEAGDFVFIGDMNFYCLKGGAANTTVSIVKKGNWKVSSKYHFYAAHSNNSKFILTNETGNVTITSSSDIVLADANGAEAEIVSITGDWTASRYTYIAKGANSTARFVLKDGKLMSPNYLVVGQGSGSVGSLVIDEGGEVKQTGNDIPIGDGASSTGIVTVKTGGKITSSSAYNGYGIRVGGNGTGTLNVQGGEVYLGSGSGALGMCTSSGYSPAGTVNVTDGGLVTASQVKHGNGSGTGTLTINGGTLKALGDNASFIPADDNLTVYVGDDGATFNTDNHAITVAEPLVALSGEAGSLTVTGGGTATFLNTGDLTGAFAIGENTTLHYFDQDGAATYALASLTLGAGSTLVINGGDSFGNTPTTINATSANKATVTVVFTSAPAANSSYALFPATAGDEAKFTITPMLGALELPHETSVVNGKLTLTITAEDYTWNGSQTYWGDVDAWTKGGASASWSDGNNAIFDTAGREAVLSAAASASEVRFTANAAISGTAALSASKIDVSSGATATISAPFGSAVQKTGAGTLTLTGGTTNAYALTLAEGTLALAGSGTALDWTKFTFGTDVSKPVTLKFEDGATVANASQMRFGETAWMTNTVYKECGDWNISDNFLLGLSDGPEQTFYHNGGTLTVGGYLSVGDFEGGAGVSHMEINGGTVTTTHSGTYTAVGSQSDGTAIVRNGGTFNVTGNMLVGNKAAGTLTIDNGGVVNVADIIFAYNTPARDSLVDLKTGGELSAYRIYYRNNGSAAVDTFRFDGGTVKCKYQELITADNHLFVKVASNGGIIDLQGRTVAINEPLLEDADSSGGGMTFKGGGVVTLASGNTYTGTTTVEVGTTVHVAAPDEIGGGIAVTVPDTPPTDDVYKLVVVDGAGTFSDAVLTGVVAPANATLRLSGDRKSILCIYGNPLNTWIGGASGSLNDNANWSLGTVPASGESCVIGNLTAASLTNPSGSAFAPASITFLADTALVTISGEGVISGITAITNNASLHHVFSCPVVCADNITPDITRGSGNYMTFAGGITMYNAPKTGSSTVDYWSGNVAVTTESAQEYKSGGNYGQLVAGTTFSFDNGKIDHMYIEPGATTVVNRLVYNGCVRSSTASKKTAWFNYVFDNGNGVIRAKEIKATGDAVLFHSWAGGDQQCGTIFAEKLTSATTAMTGGGGWDWPLFFLNGGQTTGSGFANNDSNGEGVWVIGHGGLSFGSDAIAQSFYGVHLGKALDNGRPAATLHSYEDWALDVHPLGASQNALEISSGHGELLVIDTSHYAVGDPVLDAATSHTVTLNGKVKGDGAMRVEGNGKVIFANVNNAFSGGLVVTNTATASVKAGCKPGNGAVTVHGGATLQVAESGTVTLGGNLTLANNATLAFNFTNRTTAPTLAVSGVTATGTVKIKVTAPANFRPSASANILTTGGGFAGANLELVADEAVPKWATGVSVDETTGNIVLGIKPAGMIFFIK